MKTFLALARTVASTGLVLAFLWSTSAPVLAQQSPPASLPSNGPVVSFPTRSAVSQPLWAIPQAHAGATLQQPKVIPLHRVPPPKSASGQPPAADRALQTKAGPHLAVQTKPASPGIGFDGFIPPDPNIAVGQDYIVQVVNSEIAVFDKSGQMLAGYPKTLGSLWSSLGGDCANNNAGDPIVQYDRFAQRWLITQLSSLSPPYGECFAISQTSDPTKAYTLYQYSSGNSLPDYPKFGIWPTAHNSAYLGTFNFFLLGAFFQGADLCAWDRTAMLSGASAPVSICWSVTDASYLPSDVDGPNPPTDGEPAYFLNFNSTSSLGLFQMTMNFGNDTSTLIGPTNLAVDPFQEACGGGTCIPQPHTKEKLDSLGDRLMYRLAYRHNSNGTETMVVNHSVVAGNSVGVRWYELEASTPGNFSVAQQGTYAPDSDYRWMGSIAMDQAGDMALGYSRSSNSTYPGIYLTGRTPTDTKDTMGSETVLQAGSGSQTGYSRWGDYTSMRIDPSDDCTFWYTDEYYPQSASYNWSTYIGSFNFPGCGSTASPNFNLSLGTSSFTLPAGGQGTTTLTVTSLNGFSTSSDLSLSTTCPSTGAPVNCSLNPTSFTAPWSSPAGSTLTVTVDPSASVGSYSYNITGQGGGITNTATFTVDVPGFGLSESPSTINTVATGSGTYTGSGTVTVKPLDGFTDDVLLKCSTTGITCSFSPNPTTSADNYSSAMTITVPGSTATGSSFTIVGSDDGGSQTTATAKASFTVDLPNPSPPPGFGITASQFNPLQIYRSNPNDNNASSTITVTGGSGGDSFSVSGLPSQTTFSVSGSASPYNLTVTAGSHGPTGTYDVTVTDTSGGISTSASPPLTLTIKK